MSSRAPSDETVAGGPATELGSTTGRTGGSAPDFVVDSGADRLLAHWESTGAPSQLADYLPDTDAIRRAALVELIKVDLDYRWLHLRQPKRIADYCREFPELLAEPLPAELVYEEFRVRRESGAAVSPDDYLAEFPQQASGFETLLDDDRRISDGTLTELAAEALGAGRRLDDFDLVDELGRGAFARVFLARQRSMQRWVALKISRNVGIEPQMLAQLDHPYIVRVFDQRVLDDRQLRVLFMEYVPGGTLLDVVRRVCDLAPEERSGGLLLDAIDHTLARNEVMVATDTASRDEIAALSWPEAVAWIGLRLADALQYASDHGVLHRDIKPANVLLGVDGTPKLADFNVSSSDTVRTRGGGGFLGGSVAYMSPEQLEAVDEGSPRSAGELDTRSDIFALGVMLWELLTGARPFDDPSNADGSPPSPAALLETRRRGIDPARTLPDCPAALRRILVKSLAPRRDQRWSSGRKLARQFALCLDPHARDLVYPPHDSWRAKMWRWSVPLLLVAIGIPNLLAAWYNYRFNKILIISSLDTSVQQNLEQVHLLVGGVAFPVGAVLILYWCRLALTVPRGLNAGRRYDDAVLQKARAAALRIGERAVVVSFCLWLVAAICYPVALQIIAGGIPAGTYARLAASLAVCGAVALAYPFFILTFFAVRCLFPMLLSRGELRSEDGRRIRSLARTQTRYLALAAAVPLIGIAGLSFGGDATTVGVRVLCVVGIVAFIVIYQLFRRIEGDLRALERVVRLEVPGSPAAGPQPRRRQRWNRSASMPTRGFLR